MRKYTVLLFCALLSACSPQITGGEVQRAVAMCNENGGVELLNTPTFFALVDFSRIYSVKCNNNKTFNINKDQ